MMDTVRGLDVAWITLVVLTLGSWGLSQGTGLSSISTVAMFAISAFKCELVLTQFMEARRAERRWLRLYRAWIVVVAIILGAAFAT